MSINKENLIRLAQQFKINTGNKTAVQLAEEINVAIDQDNADERENAERDKRRREEQAESERREELAFQRQRQIEKDRMDHELQLARVQSGRDNRQEWKVKPIVKMQRLGDTDDPLVFFSSLEKLLVAKHISEDDYAGVTVELLGSKALEAYSRLSLEDAMEYNAIKAAVLKKFNISSESTRLLFREARKVGNESYAEFGTRLQRLSSAWVKEAGVDDLEKMLELIALEQYLETVDTDVRVWLVDKEVKDVKTAAELTDNYHQTRKRTTNVMQQSVLIPKVTGSVVNNNVCPGLGGSVSLVDNVQASASVGGAMRGGQQRVGGYNSGGYSGGSYNNGGSYGQRGFNFQRFGGGYGQRGFNFQHRGDYGPRYRPGNNYDNSNNNNQSKNW